MEVRHPQRLLFVAGTRGLDLTGAPGSALDEQLHAVCSDIRAILARRG